MINWTLIYLMSNIYYKNHVILNTEPFEIMTHVHTYSAYTKDAAKLMGDLIQIGRKERRWTESNLAERAGISRSTLRSIEQGNLGYSIGLVFEVAALVGVRLFDLDPMQLSNQIRHTQMELTVLPTRIRKDPNLGRDNF